MPLARVYHEVSLPLEIIVTSKRFGGIILKSTTDIKAYTSNNQNIKIKRKRNYVALNLEFPVLVPIVLQLGTFQLMMKGQKN